MIDIARVKEIVAGDEIADMLRKYKFVTGALFNTDVSDDYTFQDAYCDLYWLNDGYSEKFITKFFYLLEEMKRMSNIFFREAFEKLREVSNENVMTAASILVHTINPRFAIWDEKLAREFFKLDMRISPICFMPTLTLRMEKRWSRLLTSGSPARRFRM